MKKRILSLLLVLVMLLSLLPAGVLAAEGDVSVTLSGMHDAQVKSLKLYTYMDGVKGADDLLAEKTAADGAYTIDLAPGAYWVDGDLIHPLQLEAAADVSDLRQPQFMG